MYIFERFSLMRDRCADLECELARYQATASDEQKKRVAQMREASTGYTPEEYAAKKDFPT